MISMMLEASRRVWYLTTSIPGLRSWMALSAESTLGVSMRVGGVDDLALEVGQVDHVVVDDADRAHAGRGQVERRGRAQPAGAQQQHLCVQQLHLALDADLRHEQVARVALALLVGELARDLDVVAAVLPQRDAAGHGRHVLVAQLLLEGLGGQRRAVARGAVQDHVVAGLGGALDARLQVPARHVLGAREVRLLELLLLAHVDDTVPLPLPIRSWTSLGSTSVICSFALRISSAPLAITFS